VLTVREKEDVMDTAGFTFDWDSAQCGTSHPTPRDNHATLWMLGNNKDTFLEDIRDFFQMAREFECLECRLAVRSSSSLSSSNSVDAKDCVEVIQDNKNVLWQGTLHGQVRPEANVGRYALFHATTEEGCKMMVKCVSLSTWGYMTCLFHDKVEIDLTSGRKIISTTGLGLNDDDKRGISTRFQLQCDDQDVARCHLSYRDGSGDPSVGPTIEMIEVRRDCRGKDYLPILWFWVHRFIQDNFTFESLNITAPAEHIMIKATNLTNREIETKDGKSVSLKNFFYNHAGFSVRKQLIFRAKPLVTDEEAVRYIPLLTPDQKKQRMETGEDFGKKFEWPQAKGARVCATCEQIRFGLLRCHQCSKIYYCDRKCQKKDWKLHKQWCGKTHNEIREVLLRQGIDL
jgi:MYND finger